MIIFITYNGSRHDESLTGSRVRASSVIDQFCREHSIGTPVQLALSTAGGIVLESNDFVEPGENLTLRPRYLH